MAVEAPNTVRRSQRRKKKKYSDHAEPRIKFLAGQLKKIAELEAKLEAKPKVKAVAADHLRIHGGKVCTSSGLATAMKRDLTAWIKSERLVREIRAQIAELPVGDSTSIVGPRYKDPIFNRHAEAKDKARECEKKVRENEHGNYELPALFLSGPLESIRLDPRRQDLLELPALKG